AQNRDPPMLAGMPIRKAECAAIHMRLACNGIHPISMTDSRPGTTRILDVPAVFIVSVTVILFFHENILLGRRQKIGLGGTIVGAAYPETARVGTARACIAAVGPLHVRSIAYRKAISDVGGTVNDLEIRGILHKKAGVPSGSDGLQGGLHGHRRIDGGSGRIHPPHARSTDIEIGDLIATIVSIHDPGERQLLLVVDTGGGVALLL